MVNNQEKQLILEDSDEAASIKTVTGWVSSNGVFFGDNERLARYSGATHKKCSKFPDEHPIIVINGYCEMCRYNQLLENYFKMEKVAWDRKTPIVILDSEQYFFDQESLDDYGKVNNVDINSLHLVLCEPNFVPQFSLSDHCEDIMVEESWFSSELEAAADALNKVIAKEKAISWEEGSKSIDLSL